MKKFLVILVALIGFGISAMSQTVLQNGCTIILKSTGDYWLYDVDGNYTGVNGKTITLLSNGCYTALKSTGDYWLYDATFKYTGVNGKTITLLSNGNYCATKSGGKYWIYNSRFEYTGMNGDGSCSTSSSSSGTSQSSTIPTWALGSWYYQGDLLFNINLLGNGYCLIWQVGDGVIMDFTSVDGNTVWFRARTDHALRSVTWLSSNQVQYYNPANGVTYIATKE